MKTLTLVLVPFALLSIASLYAATVVADDAYPTGMAPTPTQTEAAPPSTPTDAQSKLWFFLGGDFGYTHLKTSAPGEYNLSGSQADVRGVLSYYSEKVVYDAGGGWFFNHLSGNEPPGPATINTRSPFAELSARYRFEGGHWQLGPVFDLTFGSDMSLTPVPTSTTNVAFLAGLQLDCEVNPENPKWRFRFIARAINSIGLDNHSLFVAQGGFQIGLPLTPAPAAVEPTQAAVAEPTTIAPPQVDTEVKPDIQIILGSQFVHFKTASAGLTKKSTQYLKAVGKMLAQKDDSWQVLEISGHTDHRGTHAVNLKLSRARAASVKKALVSGGASKSKIRSQGYAYDRPVDPAQDEQAWAKNRRVEMNFMKASDPAAIQEGMDQVRAKFQ